MSRKNGDKSRFNRERKQKIARRQRNREFLKSVEPQPRAGVEKPRERTA
ncbi:MAG TPA: hypothetical protein VF011_01320 [Terriglobales bacterium]